MKLRVLVFLGLGVSLLAGCASDAGQRQKVASSMERKSGGSNSLEGEESREICKVRSITGSRFKKKTCMTAEEWENMARESKKMLDQNTRKKVKIDP